METSNSPLVSVIIPAYNAEKFIGKTLSSVTNQTYQDLEIIVIDDGSQDRTQEVVRQFMDRDNPIQLLQQANSGVAAARNLGIRQAKGEFIAPIDADDIWYPDNIEKQVNCMISGGEKVGLVYSWSVDIDKKDVPTGAFRAACIEGEVYATLVCHNFLGNASCSMMRRSIVQELGGYNPDLRGQNAQGCEDWDLYLKIAQTYQVKAVCDFLVGYRKLPESMSRNYETMARSHALMLDNVQKKHPDIPNFLYNLSRSNLYIYFAHQSCFTQDYSTTLFWLKKALKAHFLATLIRPGFYRLIILTSLNGTNKDFARETNSQDNSLSQEKNSESKLTLADVAEYKLKRQLMLLIGSVFHKFIEFCSKPKNKKYSLKSSI